MFAREGFNMDALETFARDRPAENRETLGIGRRRMNKRILSILAITFFGAPSLSAGQGLAVGARAGTLGFGGEAALDLSQNIVARGGIGSFFLDFDGDYDGVEYTVSPPSVTGTVGLDFYPSGRTFRLMAGVMFRSGGFDLESGDLSQAGNIEIGDHEYNDAGSLSGALDSRTAAPFLGIGFARHTRGGFGFFLDLGVGFVGEPDVSLTAHGPIASAPGIQEDLDKEIQNVRDDAGSYLRYWPILNMGVKIHVG